LLCRKDAGMVVATPRRSRNSQPFRATGASPPRRKPSFLQSIWHSNQSCLNLCFDELDFKEFVNDSDLRVDTLKLVRHVKNKSHRHDSPDEQLILGLQHCIASSNKNWYRVRRRDLIDILSVAFRKTLGSCKAQDITREHWELGLRLAYSEDAFSVTQLFLRVRQWETNNSPFRVFRKLRQQMLEME
jgi:hypothetical protein